MRLVCFFFVYQTLKNTNNTIKVIFGGNDYENQKYKKVLFVIYSRGGGICGDGDDMAGAYPLVDDDCGRTLLYAVLGGGREDAR